MCELKKFCFFCVSLRTGGKILGWIGIIESILVMGMCGFVLSQYKMFVSAIQSLESMKLKPIDDHISAKVLAENEKYFTIFFAFLLIFSLVELMCSMNLLIGVNKMRSSFILPWLLFDLVFATMFAVSFGVIGFLVSLAIFSVHFYWWLCIFSLYMVTLQSRSRESRAESLNLKYMLFNKV
jgi:hypothetical protein